RSRNWPPYLRTQSQLRRAVRAPPTCRYPVGDGAKRRRCVMSKSRVHRSDQWRLKSPPIGGLLNGTDGKGGILTLDTGFSPYNGLANRRLQPLGHLSGICLQQFSTRILRLIAKHIELSATQGRNTAIPTHAALIRRCQDEEYAPEPQGPNRIQTDKRRIFSGRSRPICSCSRGTWFHFRLDFRSLPSVDKPARPKSVRVGGYRRHCASHEHAICTHRSDMSDLPHASGNNRASRCYCGIHAARTLLARGRHRREPERTHPRSRLARS